MHNLLKKSNLNSNKIFFPYIFLIAFFLFVITNNHQALFISEYIFFPVLFIISGIIYIYNSKFSSANSHLFFSFSCLFLLMIISTMFNFDLSDRGTFLSYSVWIVVFFVVLFMPINKKSIDALLSSFVLSGLILSLVVILTQHHYIYTGSFRFTIKFGNNLEIDPNYLGSYLFVAVSYSLFFLTKTNSIKGLTKILYILATAIILIAIALTGSRSAYLSAFIVTMAYFLSKVNFKKKMFNNLILTVLFIIFIIVVLNFLPEHVKERFVFDSLFDESNSKRLIHWKYGLQTLGKSPLFGFGAGHTQNLIRFFTGHNGDAHNTYLTLLLHFGIIGFAVIVYIFFCLIKNFLKSKNVFWKGFIIAFLLNNFFIANHLGISFWSPIILFYFMALIPKEYINC